MILKAPWEVAILRDAGKRLGEVMVHLRESTRAGVSGLDLDAIAGEHIRRLGATSSFLGYQAGRAPPYPASICVSVNEEVIHGIPSHLTFRDGDIVSVDVGLRWNGYHVDAAFTVAVGFINPQQERLTRCAEAALSAGILAVQPKARVGDIGAVVEQVTRSEGFGLVREFAGHGIGRSLHEPPWVPNYGKRGTGPLLKPGLVLAIEPMVLSGAEKIRILEDGWTVVACDGAPSAHVEHTVVVTERGVEVLTILEES